jgi:hypothetical protein
VPIIDILANGGKSYMPAPCPTHAPAPRGEVHGWSRDVARRNTDFLLSVEAPKLTGHGYAVSLTIKDCPRTPQDWQTLRNTFVKRLRRMGMARAHWLTEWQRRGVPHMHAAIWFDQEQDRARIMQHWLEAAAPYRAGIYSQDVKPIHGTVGWFEYLAKHATRSVTNYQRSPENIPKLWSGRTGRMWGYLGEWPTGEPKQVEVEPRPWWQYRRLMIRYQVGKARRQKDAGRYRYLSGYRSRAPKETSRCQALPRFWIPERDNWELLTLAMTTHPDPEKDGQST